MLTLAGCQLRVDVAIDVDDDGSGTVTIGVGLDDDAIDQLPDLDGDGERTGRDLRRLARTDDLEATGWVITGPVQEDDGFTWLRASKPFPTAEQAAAVLDEVTGADGPFRDFELTRDSSFRTTSFGFGGTVDFSGGLESLGDEALANELDGEPLGEDVETIERRLGTTIDRLVRVRVALRLPGDVESNAPTQADNGAVWQPRVGGEPVELEASSEVSHTAALVWLVVSVVAGFALVALVVVRLAVWRRRRNSPAVTS